MSHVLHYRPRKESKLPTSQSVFCALCNLLQQTKHSAIFSSIIKNNNSITHIFIAKQSIGMLISNSKNFVYYNRNYFKEENQLNMKRRIAL